MTAPSKFPGSVLCLCSKAGVTSMWSSDPSWAGLPQECCVSPHGLLLCSLMARSFSAVQFASGSRSTPRTRASSRAFPRSGRLLISSLPTPFSISSSSILLAELWERLPGTDLWLQKGQPQHCSAFGENWNENKSRSLLSSQLPPGQVWLSCCPLGWHRVRIYGFLIFSISFFGFYN